LREERDRLILFINQQRPKEVDYRKRENDLKDRIAQVEEFEKKLRERENRVAIDEAALTDLMGEAQRPELEIEQLRLENQELSKRLDELVGENRRASTESRSSLESLRLTLASEIAKRKETESEAAAEHNKLISLTEEYITLCEELASLHARYARECKLLKSMRDEVTSLKQEKLDLSQRSEILLAQILNKDKKIVSLARSNSKLKVEVQHLSVQISNLQPASFSISDIDLVHALSEEVSELFWPPPEIVSLGLGPIDKDDFERYLDSLGITPYTNGCPWIIVGREGWTENELNDLLDKANFDEVRVFSQELFIAGILSTHDPFSLPTEILMKFAEGHPALEYLINSGFEWPEVILEVDYGEPVYLRGSGEPVEQSPLCRMGYHVGSTKGESRSIRRSLLEEAYLGDLPEVEDADYMEEWGRPHQSKRLWRIAHHIARLIRWRKNLPSMSDAVEDWQDDLDWMEEQFYTKRMRFTWPYG
jgi:hypothetical protein